MVPIILTSAVPIRVSNLVPIMIIFFRQVSSTGDADFYGKRLLGDNEKIKLLGRWSEQEDVAATTFEASTFLKSSDT